MAWSGRTVIYREIVSAKGGGDTEIYMANLDATCFQLVSKNRKKRNCPVMKDE